MPRQGRKQSESGYYHIILRGVNRQDIFHDDADRRKFLEAVERFSEGSIGIVAYCLMDNHVHLLLNTSGELSAFIKRLASSYVYYFNHKYDRVGHLFQDRYRSEPIDTDEYLLAASRYILQNPPRAGICKAEEYPWSSWRDAETGVGLCATQALCDIIGNRQALMAFMKTPGNDRCLESDDQAPVKDGEACRLLCHIFGVDHPTRIAGLPRDEQKEGLVQAKRERLSIRQIARLTGLDRNVIQRA